MAVRFFAMLAVLGSMLSATGAEADDPTPPPTLPLRVSAPHSLVALVTGFAKEYTGLNGIEITVLERSSNAASSELRAGNVDVALSDSETTDIAYHDTQIAAVPFAIVANTATGVKALSTQSIKALFEHRVTSWKDAGGANIPVVTIERPRRSATELLLESAFTLDPTRRADTIEDASGSVVAAVRSNPGGIGIVGLPFAGTLDGVSVITIGTAQPNAKTIAARAYPLFAFEHAVTFGASTQAASRFIAFITTQTVAWRENGFIPIRDLRT